MKQILLALCAAAIFPAVADINRMQGCQAALEFLDQKLETTTQYPADELAFVKTGLRDYNAFIQQTVIDPGLLKFTNGDTAAAADFQVQIDEFKAGVTTAWHERFPAAEIKSDHVMAVNQCTETAVPTGAGLEQLKETLETMARWTGLL